MNDSPQSHLFARAVKIRMDGVNCELDKSIFQLINI